MKYSIKTSANSVEIVKGDAGESGFQPIDAELLPDIYAALDERRQIRIQNNRLEVSPVAPFTGAAWVWESGHWADTRASDVEWHIVRSRRDQMLRASDWTQLPDVPLATKEMWANYRQALRGVTLQPDPFNIVWPVAP